MPDRRTIRIFLNGMCAMCLLFLLTIAGTIWYTHTFRDPAEDAAFEAQMREHEAFLAEHERIMAEHARRMEELAQRPREEKPSPCP